MDDWVAHTEELLKSARAGSQQAWGELTRSYNKRARPYLQNQLQDRMVAEEVLQTVWTEFFITVREQLPENGWALFACILKRRIVDAIRKKGRNREYAVLNAPVRREDGDHEEQTHLDWIAAVEQDVVEMVADAEERAVLHQLIDELPVHYQRVVKARYFQRLPFKEVAPLLIAEGLMDDAGDGVKRAQEYAYRALAVLGSRLTALGITRGRKSR